MRALTVIPGQAGSARLEEVPEPPVADGPVLVETLTVGVCGTDLDIVQAAYELCGRRAGNGSSSATSRSAG
jgi:glucose 1-dehydrogenase